MTVIDIYVTILKALSLAFF